MDNNENKKGNTSAPSDNAPNGEKKDRNYYKNRRRNHNYGKKKNFKNKNENARDAENETENENVKAEAEEAEPIVEEVVDAAEEVPASDTEKSEKEEKDEKEVEIIGIRFRNSGKVYYFSPGSIKFVSGEHAIVETVRGLEYGDVSVGNRMVSVKEIVSPLKTVIRKATEEDSERNAQNRVLEEAARPIWDEAIKKHSLVMQLVDIEYAFDNTKLIFYFTADGRVDFRDLVKDLASTFRTRIELRQIGVRDEAKLIGGLGICGRPFCCKTFLSDLNQVTIRMAKDQNLSLSSAKISGNCGKLMCCLKFEHEVYEREYASFPKVDSLVSTSQGKGVIVESNFLTRKVKVKMNDTNGTLKVFAPSEVKVIGMAKNEAMDKSLLALEDK